MPIGKAKLLAASMEKRLAAQYQKPSCKDCYKNLVYAAAKMCEAEISEFDGKDDEILFARYKNQIGMVSDISSAQTVAPPKPGGPMANTMMRIGAGCLGRLGKLRSRLADSLTKQGKLGEACEIVEQDLKLVAVMSSSRDFWALRAAEFLRKEAVLAVIRISTFNPPENCTAKLNAALDAARLTEAQVAEAVLGEIAWENKQLTAYLEEQPDKREEIEKQKLWHLAFWELVFIDYEKGKSLAEAVDFYSRGLPKYVSESNRESIPRLVVASRFSPTFIRDIQENANSQIDAAKIKLNGKNPERRTTE